MGRFLLKGAFALLLWPSCVVQKEAPAPLTPPPPIRPVGELSQRGLLPVDPQVEARQALAVRYAQRERRFRDAYEPGSLWAFLRVEQSDIDSRRISGERLVEIGQELFATDFGPEQGLGNGLGPRQSPLAGPRPAPNLRHVHYKEFGGPDATRCLSCHHLGGEGGAGFRADDALLDGDGEHPDSALERNPPVLAGAALLQLLAQEMTAELQAQYRAALARPDGAEAAVPLSAKGISFGTLRFLRGGGVDPAGLSGVDADLVVRPFGRKGTMATLRQAVERALLQNLGVQPESWVNDPARQKDPLSAQMLGDGPNPLDPDGDGVIREATEGMVTALVLYLAALAPPIEEMPEDPGFLLRATHGAELFKQVGCAGCHVPELALSGTTIALGPDPRSEPRVDLSPLLTSPSKLSRMATVRIFSDLKRHDMGPELAEKRDFHGVRRSEWLTPPLWGMAASAPYLHDGRASTMNEAIAAHDGEARASRQAYEKLKDQEQGALHLFLLTLDRPHHLEFRR
jgi:mono/diheme cytochrome c family protein